MRSKAEERCETPQGWLSLSVKPCAAWMRRPSLQGSIHGVFDTRAALRQDLNFSSSHLEACGKIG